MTIINIIHYPIEYALWEGDSPTVQWTTGDGEICAIWDGNWSQIFGNEVLKVDDSIEYEIWRPDTRADRVFSYTYPNGLVYKLFPSKKLSYFYGLKRESIYFSEEVLEAIEENIKQDKKIVLHINAAFRYHDKLILDRFYGRVPIVAQFYTNPLLQFQSEKTYNPIKIVHRLLLKLAVEKYNKKLAYIIPSTENGMDYFVQKYGAKVFYRREFANFGIDFEFWDRDISKPDAKARLGIPQEAKMFFASSRLVSEKQLDKMFMAFARLEDCNFMIYISGNGPESHTNFLKDLVKSLGLKERVEFIGFVPENILKMYYLAADYFISTSKSEAGPYSTAIAAFLGIPIITTRTGLVYELLYFHKSGKYLNNSDFSEWHQTLDEVLKGELINVCDQKIIRDYFDWSRIATFHAETYELVSRDFYSSRYKIKEN